jgi:hypothetical protein
MASVEEQYNRIVADQCSKMEIDAMYKSHQYHEIIEHAIYVNCTTYLVCLKNVLRVFDARLDYQRYLYFALKHGRQNSVKYILDHEFSGDDSVVYTAISTGNSKLAEMLCEHKFDWPHVKLNGATIHGYPLFDKCAALHTYLNRPREVIQYNTLSCNMSGVVLEYNEHTRAKASVAEMIAL